VRGSDLSLSDPVSSSTPHRDLRVDPESGRGDRRAASCGQLCQPVAVGIVVGWIVRGHWFFIAGFLILILALFSPASSHTIRVAAFSLALALILGQLVVVFRDASRERAANSSSQRPDPH
jgi:hypothetical protein